MKLDKAKLAHDCALELIKKPDFKAWNFEKAADYAWQYADAMQAEADKRAERGVPEVIGGLVNQSKHKLLECMCVSGCCLECAKIITGETA